ncbi:MAG TPA: alpha/beta hydrolase [Nocardioides sp.]|uniref:alpha/beta fold hydrolase n=1 Tax=Nocardioides sp. TaxID=35761 RepID=UPI002F40A752
MWDPIADRLSEEHRVVTVDLPGHGGSDGSAADPTEVVSRLHSTLTALQIDLPVVVGHSAGAMLATGYAATWPVHSVVNVDQPLTVAGFSAFVQQKAADLSGPNFSGAFAPFEESIGCERLPRPERDRVQRLRTIRQDVVLDHWHVPLTAEPHELQQMVDAMLAKIPVPYVYLAGEEPPAPVREHLLSHVANPRIVTWPGGGHLVHLADPARFADLVADVAAGRDGWAPVT